jgi:hypothetical protein
MAQIDIRDIDQIKKAVSHLRKLKNSLEYAQADYRAIMAGLGEAWKDQDFQKFNGECDLSLRSLKQVAEKVLTLEQYLDKKEQAAQKYLDTKL